MTRRFRALFSIFLMLVVSSAWSQSAPQAAVPPVDINHASSSELKSVPGIGEAYSSRIIAGRPYKNKAQLKSRGILPAEVYEKVKDRLVARQN
jgi:DNA uptake protein ComE-like DNA-binding protein